MPDSVETKVTKVLNNVIIKPTWEEYSPTGEGPLTAKNDNIQSQENLVTSLSKIQAWIKQIDETIITKEELGDTNAARIKGILNSKEELPAEGNKSGDIYLVKLSDDEKDDSEMEDPEGEAPIGDLYESYIWIVEKDFKTAEDDPDDEEEEEEEEADETAGEDGHWEYVGKHSIVTPMDAYEAGAGIDISSADEDDGTTKTVKVKLVSETPLKATAAVAESETDEGQVYPTRVDTAGNLATVVPWTDKQVEQKVITGTTGTNDFYSLLFGGTKMAVEVGSETLNIETVKSAVGSGETGAVNKTANLFVNIGKDGVTTLYSDIFVGLTPTQDLKTCDNQMASTEFVHNLLKNALLSDKGIKSIFEGQGPIEVSYHAAGDDETEDPEKTYIIHKKPEDFTKAETEGFYKITTDEYGHVTKATKASVNDLTELEAYKAPSTTEDDQETTKTPGKNTKILTLNEEGKIEVEDWSVLQLNCIADDSDGTTEADLLKAALLRVDETLTEVL